MNMARECCRRSLAAGVVVPAVAAALVPKCPLCIAAYLSAIGVSVGGAAPWLVAIRPALVLLAIVVLGVAAISRQQPPPR
jgi:hypothetical protein